MIRLSIPVRQALSRLTLPVLIAVAFGVMLLGKADAQLAERVRMALADALAPIFGVVSEPIASVHDAVSDAGNLLSLRAENVRLHEENDRLRQWQAVAMALDAENTALKSNLNWIPDPAPSYVTARVVADAGGVYARAVLLSTDINSRIPVTLEGSRGRAMLVGTNNNRPRLMFWPEGSMPAEGERVVTSAEAGAFPSGLPIGVVHYTASNVPEVEPFARLDRLEVVRIFDYGLTGIRPPEAPSRLVADRKR